MIRGRQVGASLLPLMRGGTKFVDGVRQDRPGFGLPRLKTCANLRNIRLLR